MSHCCLPHIKFLDGVEIQDSSITGSSITGSTVETPYITLFPPVAANPDGPTTLWINSVGDSLSFGNGSVLVDQSPTDPTYIPVYYNAVGGVTTAPTTVSANLARPLDINTTNLRVGSFRSSDMNCELVIGTTSASTNRGMVSFGNGATPRWSVGTDRNMNGGDDFFIYRNGPRALYINASDQIVGVNYGLRATRYDWVALPSNPGTSNTVWQDSASSWLMFGNDTILTNINLPAFLNVTYSGTWTLSSPWFAASVPVVASAVRVGRHVMVKFDPFVANSAGIGADYVYITPDAGFLAQIGLGVQNDNDIIAHYGTFILVTSGARDNGLGWKWQASFGRFVLCMDIPLVWAASTITSFNASGFTYMSFYV